MNVMDYTGPSQMRIGWHGVSGAQAIGNPAYTKDASVNRRYGLIEGTSNKGCGPSLELGNAVTLDHEIAAPVGDDHQQRRQ